MSNVQCPMSITEKTLDFGLWTSQMRKVGLPPLFGEEKHLVIIIFFFFFQLIIHQLIITVIFDEYLHAAR